MIALEALNEASAAEFVAALDGLVERAPWVLQAAAAHRPYPTVTALLDGLLRALEAAPLADQLAFLNRHEPLVAGPLPIGLTEASRREQGDAPLGTLIAPAALAALNRDYQARFGYPFILCLRRHSSANVLRQLRARLTAAPAAEWHMALQEIGHVVRLRLLDRVAGPGLPRAAGSILAELTRPSRATLSLEGVTLFAAPLPPGRHLLLQGAPLRLGHYRLQLDGAAIDAWPQLAESDHLLSDRQGPAPAGFA